MRLDRLIHELAQIETLLRQSIIDEFLPLTDQVRLTRRAADLMDRIEAFRAQTHADLRTQIGFFLGRGQGSAGESRRALAIALDLMGGLERADGCAGPRQDPEQVARDVALRLVARRAPIGALAEHVSRSPHRMSMFRLDGHHIATSRGNAAFHMRPASEFTGLHMADITGVRRFEGWARARFEKCLTGRAQTYYYSLDLSPLGPRIIQCHMAPVRSTDDRVQGALVWVSDRTDTIADTSKFVGV